MRADVVVSAPHIGEESVFDHPVFTHTLIGIELFFCQFDCSHLCAGDRVLNKSFPASEVLAVEERHESLIGARFSQSTDDGIALGTCKFEGSLCEKRARDGTVELLVAHCDFVDTLGSGLSELLIGKIVAKHSHTDEGASVTDLFQQIFLCLHSSGGSENITQANEVGLALIGYLGVCTSRDEQCEQQ